MKQKSKKSIANDNHCTLIPVTFLLSSFSTISYLSVYFLDVEGKVWVFSPGK